MLADFTPQAIAQNNPRQDVRALFASRRLAAGSFKWHAGKYVRITDNTFLSEPTIKEVAMYGMETVDRDKIFKGWKKKYKK